MENLTKIIINKKEVSVRVVNPMDCTVTEKLNKVNIAILITPVSKYTETGKLVYSHHTISFMGMKELKNHKNFYKEFKQRIPFLSTITTKPVLNYIYQNAKCGVKVLETPIGNFDKYYVKFNGKKSQALTRGELIALAIQMYANKYGLHPLFEIGPGKIIYMMEKKNFLEIILKKLEIYEEYVKMKVPQKQYKRVKKLLAPLKKVEGAKIAIGNKYDKHEGIVFVSKSFAQKKNLCEGMKLASVLKSLICIVPDENIAGYDILIGNKENKWKLNFKKLEKHIRIFKGDTPDIHFNLEKVMTFKSNMNFVLNIQNSIKTKDINIYMAIRDAYINNDISKISNEDQTEFLPEVEKILFDILSYNVFNKDEKEREKHYIISQSNCDIFNKYYVRTEDGRTLFVKGNGKVSLNTIQYRSILNSLTKVLRENICHTHFIGGTGKVFPLALMPDDVRLVGLEVPIPHNVKKRMDKLGISEGMVYIQRHPSIIGVWADLYYSPSTKLFYVDKKLWEIYFGGDFDGDGINFIYPFHRKNKKMNGKNIIYQPILIDRMTTFVYPRDKEFLLGLNELNKKIDLKNNFKIEKREKHRVLKLNTMQNWANAYDANAIVGKLHSMIYNGLAISTYGMEFKDFVSYSNYFVMKYVQPAIEGLKHDATAFMPSLDSLSKEMYLVRKIMFGNKYNSPISREDIFVNNKYLIAVKSAKSFAWPEKVKDKNGNIFNKVKKDGSLVYKKGDLLRDYPISKIQDNFWVRVYNKMVDEGKKMLIK